MLYNENKQIDQTWAAIYAGPDPIVCSKYALKDKVTVAKVRNIGSPKVVGFTRGIYEAEDTVVEMTAMAFYGLFLPSLGATEVNGVLVNAGDRDFELVETIVDKSPLGAGSVTNIAKGCRVIGFEKSTENTEAATMVSVTIAIREIVWGATSRGGAGATLAA